jgi:hypothetical protein
MTEKQKTIKKKTKNNQKQSKKSKRQVEMDFSAVNRQMNVHEHNAI